MTERHPAGLIAVLAGVQLLAVLDGLAAALALPAIAADLGLSTAGRAWVLNATSVALAGGLLVAGRLGDVWGRRRVFLAGILLLLLGSVVCGAAPTAEVLLAGRVVLGLGAAVAYPSALSLTSSSFRDEPWRGRAFTAAAVAGALGSLSGAVYGGAVTGLLGWRWVFWLTVPLALALYVGGRRLVPADAVPQTRRPLDLLGAVLATCAVTAVVAAAIGAGTGSLPPVPAAALVVVAGAAVVLLVAHERRAADPLLPGVVVRQRRLWGGCCGNAANSALWSVVVFVLAQELQADGWSATRAGLATLPASVGIVASGLLVVPPLRRRLGSVRTAAGGLLLSACCVAALTLSTAQPSFLTHLAVPLLLLGAGLNATHTGLTEHTLKHGIDGAETISAAVFEASTHVGGAVAVSLFAAVLAAGPAGPAYLIAAAAGVIGAVAVSVWSTTPAPGPPGSSSTRRARRSTRNAAGVT